MSSSRGSSRRKFVRDACATAATLGLLPYGGSLDAISRTPAASKHSPDLPFMKPGLDVDVNNAELLRFMKQIGVEWVCTSLPPSQGKQIDASLTQGAVMSGYDRSRGGIGGPPGGLSGPWKEEELSQLIGKVDKAGLKLGSLYIHSFPNVILGNAERDSDIEHVCESIRIAGRLGVPVLLYNFYGLRNVEGLYSKPGRGGAAYRAFDNKLVKDNTPLPALGIINDDTMWRRLQYFLHAVIPVAEAAGVRLAQHPNDPPVLSYRGVAQPFATIEHWKRLVNFIPSPANGIVLDTGVIAQLGGDVADTIRYFGKKNCINHVHFRNARTMGTDGGYFESFIDEGAANMMTAMKALKEIGYSGGIVPDHSPSISGDANHFGAWGYALGYIRALLLAVEG